MRILLSLVFAAALVPLGYVLGWVASYYLGDRGDVGTAFLTLLTIPLGVVIGAVAGVILAAKMIRPR